MSFSAVTACLGALVPPLGVVPVKVGPPAVLVLLLPPLAVGMVLALRWAPPAWAWGPAAARLAERLRARPVLVVAVLAGAAAVGAAGWWAMQPLAAETVEAGGPAGGGDWPTFRAGPTRCGAAARPALGPSKRVTWKFRESQLLERRAFGGSPALAGRSVLVGSDNYKLYCLDLDTGRPRWTFEARWPVFSSPAVSGGRVYVGEGLHEHTDCRLYCLDLATGKRLWSVQTTSHTESPPTVAGPRVYFGAGDDGLYCADARSGRVIWRYPDAHVDGCPLVAGGRVYAGSGYGFQGLLCLSAAEGRLVWRRPLPAAAWGAPSWADGRLYVALGNGTFEASAERPFGEVRCLDAATGQDIWRFGGVRDAVLTSLALSDGLTVFASRDGACYALDAATGTLRWRTDVGSPVLSSPAVAGGAVLFGADDGLFRCLALADGRVLWSVDTTDDGSVISPDPRIQSSPAVGGEGQVVFGAANGHVYCLAPASASSAPAKAPAVAETGRQGRLMWAADALVGGLLRRLAGWTGSTGAALLLAGAVVALGLAPLSWAQARRLARTRAIEAEFRPSHTRHVTSSGHRRELARWLVDAGANPLAGLAIALVHLGVVVVVLLTVQGGADLAGRRFAGIANLALPDRLVRLNLAGGGVHVLPLLLAAAVWAFWWLTGPRGQASLPGRHIAPAVVAVAVAVLTWRWPAGMHLFALGMVGLAAVGARILRTMGNETQAL